MLKNFLPRAGTGNTRHGMRYAGEKPFSNENNKRLNLQTNLKSFENQCYVEKMVNTHRTGRFGRIVCGKQALYPPLITCPAECKKK